ncbi:CHAT domain-containing protein [Streptomyces sp. NPDC051976]|uniref:CHAT domain-containing protein n=1 Tax=Streptomyces sp. NPDC051976 TaxID=3154947 RepID=UPI00341E6000
MGEGGASGTARWLTGARQGPGAAAHTPRPVPLAAPRQAVAPEAATPSAETTLGALPADPEERLPPGLAKLLVQRVRDGEGNQAFLLSGAVGGDELPYSDGPQLRPFTISLGRVRRDGAFPSQVYRAVQGWSRRQLPLVRWLNTLRARYGDELHLVVWDDTDYDIPWEMLWLGPPESPGLPAGWLGALVPTARWTTIREVERPLLEGPAECAGEVIGYFDGTMREDADAFRDFVHQRHEETSAFLAALDRVDRPPGMVYMGCHGTYGDGVDDLTVGLLTWYEMDEPMMSALAGQNTLVLLNVCDSGRLVDNRDGGEDALRGFPELFLRKGARACIATGGQVGETEARSLLAHLVEHARSTPERPLARMLRDFRARAAADLPVPVPRTMRDDGAVDNEGQRQVLRFLHQFMYVYYGHPLTTLRLTRRVQEGAP